MAIIKNSPPKKSVNTLARTLRSLSWLKTNRKSWIRIHPGEIRNAHVLYANPLYTVHLSDLLAGRSLAATLRRIGWLYFLRSTNQRLACAEVSKVADKHTNARLSEGLFVGNAFRRIRKVAHDRRLSKSSFELRSVRLESLHGFVLWVKARTNDEYWVLVTPLGDRPSGAWLTRQNFTDLLTREAKRVVASHERARQLAGQKFRGDPTGPLSSIS